MYSPKQFEEQRTDVLHQLIQEHAFGTLVTRDGESLNADHLPFEIDMRTGSRGTLRAHVARANPLWQRATHSTESLAIFQGPHTYITPSWYASKQEHGKVVPTWNYMVVHAYGPIQAIEDPVWLLGLVERLTARHESGRALPWMVGDAPADYIQSMLGAIVGIEIPISRLIGKWKVSQNRPAADREGVIDGLMQYGDTAGRMMADVVRNTGGR